MSISIACFSCEAETKILEEKKGVDVVDLTDPWRGLESHAYSFNALKAKNYLASVRLHQLASHIQYNVSVHRYTYETTYKNSVVTASGAIAIPIGKVNPSILVYHHGTMFYEGAAPSVQTKTTDWGMELTAAAGYIVFLPDYIGYGTTSEMLHPYHLYRPTVDSSIDMIVSAKTFLHAIQIPFDDGGIFLGGHSEGGYAAFAVQKEIETNPMLTIEIKASAPGAGAYDLAYQFNVTTDQDWYPGPGYMGLALTAYNEYYLNFPLTYFFKSPYAEKMSDLISGKHQEDYVHSQLPTRLSGFIDSQFLQSYKTDPNHIFAVHLSENNIDNFAVKTPTVFIHGKRDDVVPFSVAEKAYNNLIESGTDPSMLKLHGFDGGHNEMEYLPIMFEWFASFE